MCVCVCMYMGFITSDSSRFFTGFGELATRVWIVAFGQAVATLFSPLELWRGRHLIFTATPVLRVVTRVWIVANCG